MGTYLCASASSLHMPVFNVKKRESLPWTGLIDMRTVSRFVIVAAAVIAKGRSKSGRQEVKEGKIIVNRDRWE
jgi:hypothetical protein